MKLCRQEAPRLKKGGSSLKKSASAVFTVQESVRNRTDGDREEEETKNRLGPWERRAWEKLSPGRKNRLLERGKAKAARSFRASAAWHKGIQTGKPEADQAGKQRQGRKGAIPSGWGREKAAIDEIEEATQADSFLPAKQKKQPAAAAKGTGRGAGPICQERDMQYGGSEVGRMAGQGTRKKGAAETAGKGGAGAVGKAAAGPAGAGAAAAKKTAERFRKMLETRQAADEQEQELALSGAEAAGASGTDGNAASGSASAEGQTAGRAAAVFSAMAAAIAGTVSSALPALGAVTLIVTLLLSAIIPAFDRPDRDGAAIIDVARRELEAAEENIGGQKYKDWYGRDGHWCAMFVTWCADQCGFIELGIVPKTASVAELHDWYDAKGQYHEKAGYVPKTGDIILFEGQGSSHTGLVESYDEAASTVTTIEGNTRGGSPFNHHISRITRNTYPVSSPRITAFCTPDYPASSVELSGGSNAEMVYRAFVDAGYTPEASAAVVGNLAGEAGTDENDDIILNSVESGGAGPGIGICQWTSPGRKNGFLAYAEERGEPWPDTGLAVQLEYMMREMSSNVWLWTSISAEYGSQYNISHAQFKACTDVEFATTVFCAKFEVCHKYNSNLEDRIEYARRVLDSFRAYRPGSGGEAQEEETGP